MRCHVLLMALACLYGNSAFSKDIKVWLSDDPKINQKVWMQSVNDPQKPGDVDAQGYLIGRFDLVYEGKTSAESVEFKADNPSKWAQVQPQGNEYSLIEGTGMYFSFDKNGLMVPGPVSIKIYQIYLSKGPAYGLVLQDSWLSAALASENVQGYHKFSLPGFSADQSIDLRNATYYASSQPGWSFSIDAAAKFTKFREPSRQGCKLEIPGGTNFLATATEVAFSWHFPVFTFWQTIDNDTKTYQFAVDTLKLRDHALVLHDSSTNTCVCQSLNAPTGNLADSCFDCACD